MDKTTKLYIDDIVKPLLSRIELLERSNEELKVQVRYLESLINHAPSYQKPTLSAAQHMRDSRISSRERESELSKKPNWNSNTKAQYSPSRPSEPHHNQKLKTKPPIPKVIRSPGKPDHEEIRSHSNSKKIQGGAKSPAADFSESKPSPQEQPNGEKNDQKNLKDRTDGSGRRGSGEEGLNSKFQQLARCNMEIITEMKQKIGIPVQVLQSGNIVDKGLSPLSEHNHSSITTPNSRSFISQFAGKKVQLK